MSQAARAINRRSMRKVDTSDFSGGGLLNRQQFDEFFLEVQDAAQIMDRVRTVFRNDPSGQIDKLGVGERLIRAASEGSAGSETDEPTTDKVDYDTVKVELPWEVSMETVEDTIEREGTADRLVELFSQQFSVDSEDLGFNGDEDDSSGGDSQAFLTINDGWIVNAEDGGSTNVDHENAGINKTIFQEMRTSLDSKYRRNPDSLAFIMSLNNKDAYQNYLSDRATSAGDAMLMTDDEPTPYGREIITPVGFPDDRIMLTDPENLIWVVQRDVNMRFTDEGEKVVKNDLFGIYNMLSRTDYAVEDTDGVVLAQNVAAP